MPAGSVRAYSYPTSLVLRSSDKYEADGYPSSRFAVSRGPDWSPSGPQEETSTNIGVRSSGWPSNAARPIMSPTQYPGVGTGDGIVEHEVHALEIGGPTSIRLIRHGIVTPGPVLASTAARNREKMLRDTANTVRTNRGRRNGYVASILPNSENRFG
jgi:hypothetical protein